MSADLSTEPPWFLVQTEPNKEVQAERNLRKGQHFATLLPMLERAAIDPAPHTIGTLCAKCHRRFSTSEGLAHHLRDFHGKRPEKRIELRDRPLFPGYLFVGFHPADRHWGSINHTRGVVRLFCDGNDRPIPVPQFEMVRLRCMLGPDGVQLQPKDLAGRWADDIGVRFVVRDGPFAGHAGVCEESDDRRIEIMLSVFGRKTKVEAPRGWVEREDAA